MRDVAYVHQGSPPQTNMVRVNGSRAVLMTILKAGVGLDARRHRRHQIAAAAGRGEPAAEPQSHAVGDQSIFVKAAVFGVIREAALAAALVGADDPAVSRQLALDGHHPHRDSARHPVLARPRCRWLGETINVMTLGGLALAVGILVDDGTVTIENINYHLEQGKADRAGDPGRRAADRHAGVRHAAVPLHRVRADVPARRRRRLSVPAAGRGGGVRADRLVHPVAHAGADAWPIICMRGHHASSGRTIGDRSRRRARAIRSSAFSRASSGASRACATRYRALLSLALGRPKTFIGGFLACVVALVRPLAVSGRELLPGGRFRADPDARPRPARHPHRGDRAPVRSDRADHPRRSFRPISSTTSSTISACRSPASTWPIRTPAPIGPEDGDALISLKEDHEPTADYVKRAAHRPAAEISRHDVLVPAGRHRLADPQFRPAGADRRAGHRQQSGSQLRLRHRSAQAHPHGPGIADLRIQQVFNYPQINVEVDRTLAGEVGLTQRDIANSLLVTLSGSAQVQPEFLAQSGERRLLSDRRADAAIPDRHHVGSRQHAGHLGGRQDAAISRRTCDTSRRARARAWSRTTTCSR